MSPQKITFLRGLTRIITDFLASLAGWWLAYAIRPWYDLIPGIDFAGETRYLPNSEHFIWFSLGASIGLVIIFAIVHLYQTHPKVHYFSVSMLNTMFLGVGLWALIIVAGYSLVAHQLFFSRIMLVHASVFALVFIILFRIFLFILWEHWFPYQRKAIILGTLEETKMLTKQLKNSSFCISTEQDETISDVFFFEHSHSDGQLREMRQWCAMQGKTLFLIPAYASEFWGHASFEVIRGIPMICASPTPPKYWWFFWKRIFDIFFSLCFLIVLSPLFLIVAIAIRLESKGQIFYVSQRVGKNGDFFPMIKFRSMFVDAEERKKDLMKHSHRNGPLFKMKNDPRITKVGKWLRKTSIDEFPNFINVLKGEMAIIGPRPHLPSEVQNYTPDQKRVLSVRPGISGLAQVSGRSDLSFEQEMILETYYTEHIGFWLDMKIFIKTPFVLLAGKGAD